MAESGSCFMISRSIRRRNESSVSALRPVRRSRIPILCPLRTEPPFAESVASTLPSGCFRADRLSSEKERRKTVGCLDGLLTGCSRKQGPIIYFPRPMILPRFRKPCWVVSLSEWDIHNLSLLFLSLLFFLLFCEEMIGPERDKDQGYS